MRHYVQRRVATCGGGLSSGRVRHPEIGPLVRPSRHDGVGFRVGRRLVCSTAPRCGVGRGNHLRGGRKAPEACYVQPVLFDGRRLPFADRSFELGYAIDVLHHCHDPRQSLLDLLRCTSRLLVIKDYTYSGLLGRLALGFLDELGKLAIRGLDAPPLPAEVGVVRLDRARGVPTADAHPSSPRPAGLSDVRPTFPVRRRVGTAGKRA